MALSPTANRRMIQIRHAKSLGVTHFGPGLLLSLGESRNVWSATSDDKLLI